MNSCCATKLVSLLSLKHGSSLLSLFQSLIFRATQSYVKFDTNNWTLFRAASITRHYRFSYALNTCRGVFLPDSSCVYHQHWSAAENEFMQEHLFQSLQLVESGFPDCALIVAGDFNRLDRKPIERHFSLKQTVKIPTRKDAILDHVLTNLDCFYVAPQGFHPLACLTIISLYCGGQSKRQLSSTI